MMKLSSEKRQEIVNRAVAHLRGGLLASALPGQLMAEFDITPALARQCAQAALKVHQAESKGDSDG